MFYTNGLFDTCLSCHLLSYSMCRKYILFFYIYTDRHTSCTFWPVRRRCIFRRWQVTDRLTSSGVSAVPPSPLSNSAGREQPPLHTSSSYRETQKQSVTSHARMPPQRGQEQRHSKPGEAKLKTYFRPESPWRRSPDMCGSGLLRVAPTGVEQHTPHHTVPISPQWPQEISLLTLLVGLRGSPPLRRSLELLNQPSPASAPLQGKDLATPITPEISLERLLPLVNYLAAWKLMPNVSQWVLHVVEKGYLIQFGSPPRCVCGVIYTLVGHEQAPVIEKGGHRGGPSSQERESGFYSGYFIVPKKGRCVPF